MAEKKEDFIILDGGMGDELRRKFPEDTWSPYQIENKPEEIIETHLDFIKAGAHVIETFNYTVTPYWLKGIVNSNQRKSTSAAQQEKNVLEDWTRLTRKAVGLAQEAVARSGDRVRIAGSLPPPGATFDAADPVLDPKTGKALPMSVEQYYQQTASVLAASPVDVLLVETCPKISFATSAVTACRRADKSKSKQVWVAFVLQSEYPFNLCSGESVGAAVRAMVALSCGPPDAILFNCSTVEAILHAIHTTRPLFRGKLGGYGNKRFIRKRYGVEQRDQQKEKSTGSSEGETAEHIDGERVDLDPGGYADWAGRWITAGASIVGGCCGIEPNHIRGLATRFGASGAGTTCGRARAIASKPTAGEKDHHPKPEANPSPHAHTTGEVPLPFQAEGEETEPLAEPLQQGERG